MSKQEGAQTRFIDNLAAHVSEARTKWLRDEVYGKFESPLQDFRSVNMLGESDWG